jgi:hypothetical protein
MRAYFNTRLLGGSATDTEGRAECLESSMPRTLPARFAIV